MSRFRPGRRAILGAFWIVLALVFFRLGRGSATFVPPPPPPLPEAGETSRFLASELFDDAAEPSWRRFPGRPGERLSYRIQHNWLPFSVGHGTIETTGPERMGDRRVMQITFEAKGLGLWYRILSVVDADGTYALRYDKESKEMRGYRHERVIYDPDAHRATYLKRRGRDEELQDRYTIEPIGARPQDPMSMIFFCRLLPLEVGRTFNVTVHTDKRDWPTIVEVPSIETIRVPAGEFECYRIEPSFEYEGLFHKESDPTLWVERESRIIVRMEVNIAVGFIRVDLTDHDLGDPAHAADWPRPVGE